MPLIPVRLEGHSMYPTFRDGEMLQVDTDAYRRTAPQVGEIVLADHPFINDCRIIKRIHSVEADNRFILHGDCPAESTDSRSFGPLSLQSILGRVVTETP